MNQLFLRVLGSPRTWFIVWGPTVSLAILLAMALWLQRADYQRQLDASALKTVAEIKAELDRIRETIPRLEQQDQRSTAEREAIKRKVEQIERQEREP